MTTKINLGSIYNINDYDELARMFLPRGSYELIHEKASEFEGIPEKLNNERKIYDKLSEKTGKSLPWGILTGVKPTKLYSQLVAKNTVTSEVLKNEYLVSDEKIELLKQIYECESRALPKNYYGKSENIAVYIGIPFCPTRCTYCTFTACVGTEKQKKEYLEAISKEIYFAEHLMKDNDIKAESVYIGGGTPSALPLPMFDELLMRVKEAFVSETTEFTVEAGRPDSITYEIAKCISKAGASRISINPQTMNEATLEAIGRHHKSKDVFEAFENARAAGIPIINSDLIAGLPGESSKDFGSSLKAIIDLKPENITIHTLALKKGAKLREEDPFFSYKKSDASDMLHIAGVMLSEFDMNPYYLYRQKQTVDNLENTGYSLKDAECLYNMRMMQEKQSVMALGAGAVSRVYFPDKDRMERVFNLADTALYIERIDEMLERKKRIFWK